MSTFCIELLLAFVKSLMLFFVAGINRR